MKSGGDCRGRVVGGLGSNAVEELDQGLPGEVPLERLGDLVVVMLGLVEGLSDRCGVLEVVGGEDFALDDRVLDLDLGEPAGVNGEVHEARVLPASWSRIDDLPRWSERLSTITTKFEPPSITFDPNRNYGGHH